MEKQPSVREQYERKQNELEIQKKESLKSAIVSMFDGEKLAELARDMPKDQFIAAAAKQIGESTGWLVELMASKESNDEKGEKLSEAMKDDEKAKILATIATIGVCTADDKDWVYTSYGDDPLVKIASQKTSGLQGVSKTTTSPRKGWFAEQEIGGEAADDIAKGFEVIAANLEQTLTEYHGKHNSAAETIGKAVSEIAALANLGAEQDRPTENGDTPGENQEF